MADRVDKKWAEKGLEAYGADAIFNTLRHYGVDLDEPGFRAAAAVEYPLSMAVDWHERWKGMGQFSRFPAAAAEELWRRFMAPELAPTDLTLVLVRLLTVLDEAVQGKPDDGTRDTRFTIVEAYLPKLPTDPGRRDKFMTEATGALGEWLEDFDSMAEELARAKLPELAARYVAIEEALLPVRKGSASALVKAASGDVAGATAELLAVADDHQRTDYARLSAVDGLMDLDRLDDARRVLLELLEKAEQGKDLELASHVVELLTALLKRDPKRADRDAIRARVESLAASLGEPVE
jgi:hypothetical protein